MDPILRQAKNYQNASGKTPFRSWIKNLDGNVRSRIYIRIRKISEFGGYGDCEPVGDGVFELKFDFGPGYRVYFGIDRDEIILLGGGDKPSQDADIRRAKRCWEDYNAEADE